MFVGKTINIYYNKDNQGKIKTIGMAMVASIVLGVVGGAFLITGIILAIVFSPKDKKIKLNGVRYMADIINITINKNISLKGSKKVVNPFVAMLQSAVLFQPLRKRMLHVRNSSALW